MVSLEFNDISACFIESRMTKIVTNNSKVYYTRRSIRELEEVLPSIDFFRINRSFIISIHAIDKVEISINGKLIVLCSLNGVPSEEVSRIKMSQFKTWLGI